MSKGIGKLQREIIAHLTDPIASTGWSPEGELRAGGICFIPSTGVYDLRSVCHTMTRLRGLKFREGAFQAAFSRAVRSLVRRGVLEKVPMVPVARVTYSDYRGRQRRIHELSDGDYLPWWSAQVRFVRLKQR